MKEKVQACEELEILWGINEWKPGYVIWTFARHRVP